MTVNSKEENFSSFFPDYVQEFGLKRIHERKTLLRFLGIILGVLILEVSEYNVNSQEENS
jgi:hypothetical protein